MIYMLVLILGVIVWIILAAVQQTETVFHRQDQRLRPAR